MNKILLIRCGKLGDSIMLFPAISLLHKYFPESEIHILTEREMASLFYLHPDITKVHSLSGLHYRRPSLLELFPLLKKLYTIRKMHFSRVFDLQDSSWLSALIAYYISRGTAWGFLNGHNAFLYQGGHGRNHNQKERTPIFISYCKVISNDKKLLLDVMSWKTLKLIIPEPKFKIPKLPKSNLVMIHSGASESYKTWSLRNYIILAKELYVIDPSLNFYFTFGPREYKRRVKAESMISFAVCVQISDIRVLAWLISKSTYFISSDTGPSHLASILQVPRIILCQPHVDWNIWYAQYDNSKCVKLSAYREKCKDCSSPCCQTSCMDNISVTDVLNAFQTISSNKKKKL